jgi:hypothetical protein
LTSNGDAQQAFIDKHLVTIADETAAPVTPGLPTPAQKPASLEVKETAKQSEVAAAPSSTSSAPITNAPAKAVPSPATKTPFPAPEPTVSKASTAKPQSILQMIEGHEREFKIGVLIAVGSFALGWLCGGSYYVRRERKRRGKLRF